MNYYLYRLNKDGEGEIYGKFISLQMAKLSAELLLIRESCFILQGDLSRLYFYNENGTWDYDLLTSLGKTEFFKVYPNPINYK